MDALWKPLKGTGEPVESAGSKAAALDRLIGADAPVPAAAVITVAAYRRVVSEGGLRSFLDALPATVDPSELERDEERVRQAFADAELPDDVRGACAEAMDEVNASHGVAVRSSATA